MAGKSGRFRLCHCLCRGFAVFAVALAAGCGPSGNDPSNVLAGFPFAEIFSTAVGNTLARTDFPIACGPGVLGIVVPDCPLRRGCFTDACVTHNECYGTCGTSQRACDDGLGNDLRAICVQTFAPAGGRRAQCLALALAYTEVTRELGSESFQASQATCTRPADATNRSIIGIDGPRVYYAIEQNDTQLALWVVDAITRELMRVHESPGETVLRVTGDSLVIAQPAAGMESGGPFDVAVASLSGGDRTVVWGRAFDFTPGKFVPAIDGDRVAWVVGDTLEVYDLVAGNVARSVPGEFGQGLVESFAHDRAVIVRCTSNCDRAWLVKVTDGQSTELPFDVQIDGQDFNLGIYDGAKANRTWLLARALSQRDTGPVVSILGYHIATDSWRVLADFPGSSAGIVELTETDALIVEQDAELFPLMLKLRLERVDLNTGQRDLVKDLSADPAVFGIAPAFDSVGIPAVFMADGRICWIDERTQRLVVYDLAERTNWTVPLEGYERDQ